MSHSVIDKDSSHLEIYYVFMLGLNVLWVYLSLIIFNLSMNQLEEVCKHQT